MLDELGRQGVHLGNVCFDWNDKNVLHYHIISLEWEDFISLGEFNFVFH